MIKKIWEKVDGRLGLIIGWVVGLATRGVLIWLKDLVMGWGITKILFGWLFK